MPPGVTTLGTIITTCQERTDNVNSSFISTAEWTSYVQASYQELYGLLVEAYGNTYFAATTFTITTDGQNTLFALPTDFFKLLGVDLLIMGTTYKVTLKPFPFAERNRLTMINSQVPQAGQQVQLLYVPRLTLPTQTTDSVDGVNGWEEYIVNDVCIKAAAKEESDIQPFVLGKSAMVERLKSEIENRDSGFPARVADVTSTDVRAMSYCLYGSNIWLRGSLTPGWYGFGGDWPDSAGWW